MSNYGIDIRTDDGDIVLDNENSVVIVAEEHSIGTGYTVRSNTTNITSYTTTNWSRFGDDIFSYYFLNLALDEEYEDPPIIAMRAGYNVSLPTVKVYSYNPTNSGYYNRVLMYAPSPRAFSLIVCAAASDAPSSALSVGSQEYGINITNSSGDAIFDSRWASLIAVTDVPTFTSPSFTVPSTGIASPSASISSQTIPSTPGAFLAPMMSGFITYYYYEESFGEGFSFLSGGGHFEPTIYQTNATTVAETAVKIRPGQSGPTQTYKNTVYNGSASSMAGSYLVIRYLNFGT